MRRCSSHPDTWPDALRGQVARWVEENGFDPNTIIQDGFMIVEYGGVTRSWVMSGNRRIPDSRTGGYLCNGYGLVYRQFTSEVSEPPEGVWRQR